MGHGTAESGIPIYFSNDESTPCGTFRKRSKSSHEKRSRVLFLRSFNFSETANDVITSFAVSEKLKERKKRTRLLFSWDDFDRFRKVPQGVDSSFEKYIGMPLSVVPCPIGKYTSYAERFQKEFEESMEELGIALEYRYQTKEYQSGRYDAQIAHALKHRKIIAEILLSFMTDKGKSEKGIERDEYIARYYPISIYSRFSGTDNTEVLGYDGGANITYKCRDSGKTETIDFTKEHIVKLAWKIDRSEEHTSELQSQSNL